jgi:hypothetical protein
MKKQLLILLLAFGSIAASSQNCLTNYTDSTYLKSIYFTFSGTSYSHWLQPWRGYLETVPAIDFLNGVGVNMNGIADKYDLYVQMLAKHGIRHARIEIPWAVINYSTGSITPSRAPGYITLLQSCKKWGIRPLILLNAHHGVPNPENYAPPAKVLTAPAPAGSTQLALNNVTGIVVGKSGFCNITEYWAAQVIVTAINGNIVTLSKPWPITMPAGTGLLMFTLKYKPFAKYGSPEYNETMNGWLTYADTVATFVAKALGTTSGNDRKFDLEVWNELAFGSYFLNINNYYNPAYDSNIDLTVRADLVNQTANHAAANPAKYQGVRINDGIANTLPWPASTTSVPRLNAIGKHPYGGYRTYPANNPGGSTPLNAMGQTASFSPIYSGVMPEYYLLGLQVEHIVRDMAPINTNIYSTVHGRNARIISGKVSPVPIFITEIGITPKDFSITDTAKGLALKNKTNSRLYSIYLNKGAKVVDIFCAVDGNLGFGMIQDNFVKYASTNTVYPTNDSMYTSPELRTISNITNKMKIGLDTTLTVTRKLSVDTICDSHNKYQFKGNGTAGHPDLFDRDVFAFLPYQVNSKRFVIHYYVMTRDVLKDLSPEQFTICISGINGTAAIVSAYDPIKNKNVPVSILSKTASRLKLSLTAADYPYLLTIDENTTSISNLNSAPAFNLTCFPNPFNDITQIVYNLPAADYVNIKLYDVVGHEVKKLSDSFENAGEHQISLEGKTLPAGIYFCKLTTGDIQQTIKLVILKQ